MKDKYNHIVVTGDCHGLFDKIEDYIDNHPDSAGCLFIIAGDFGCPWPRLPQTNKEMLEFLGSYKDMDIDFLVVLGNHEWYDLIDSMPDIEWGGGTVKQCLYHDKAYHNITYVNTPQFFVVDVNNKLRHILCVPGADSHDIDNGIIEPITIPDEYTTNDEWVSANYDYINNYIKKNNIYGGTRINHVSWFAQEKVNLDALDKLLAEHDGERLDYVITHEAPRFMVQKCLRGWDRAMYPPNEAQDKFDELLDKLPFHQWFHGHIHRDSVVDYEDKIITAAYYSFIWLK